MEKTRIIDLRKHDKLILTEREITANVSVFFDLSLESERDIFDFWFDGSALGDIIDGYLIHYSDSDDRSTIVGETLVTKRGTINITSADGHAEESFTIRIEQRQDIELQTTYWTGTFILHIDGSANTSVIVLPSSRGSLSNILKNYIIPATITKYIFA